VTRLKPAEQAPAPRRSCSPSGADASPLFPLPRSFYLRPTTDVAEDLIGRYLVRYSPETPSPDTSSSREASPSPERSMKIGRIVEAEAYVGEHDRASHARAGRTARTAPMYEEAGRAYIYRIYGMYWCLNVVTEPVGTPCAILLRAVEPVAGISQATNGPGKLCRAYGLDGTWNRTDLTASPLRITVGGDLSRCAVARSPRVGVPYAGAWAEEPLRFFDPASPFVSRRPGSTRRPQAAVE
jgi:DNA-3-methyladenine glycosylase